MQNLPKVSLVIPFYNDQERLLARLGLVFEYFEEQGYPYEVLLVDDGSQIDHSDKIKSIFPQVIVHRYPENRGKGYAIRYGMLQARGEYRFYTDSELPFGLEPMTKAMHYLVVKEFDLVIGDRQLPASNYHIHMSKARKLASKLFTSFISRIVVTGVQDTQCGFKGFRAAIAEAIFSRSRVDGFAFDVEVVYIAFKHNFDLKRIPVVLESHEGSTLRLSRDAWRMLWDVFRIKWNHINGCYR